MKMLIYDMLIIIILALVTCLDNAISDHRHGNVLSPFDAHNRIKDLYTWPNVARRTEIVYDHVKELVPRQLPDRIKR